MLRDNLYKVEHLTITDKLIECTIQLNADHPIFAGHFPDQPVVPGVCLLQMVKEVLELALNQTVILTKADYLKFIAPVIPHANQLLRLQLKHSVVEDQAVKVSAILAADTVTCFKFQGGFKPTI